MSYIKKLRDFEQTGLFRRWLYNPNHWISKDIIYDRPRVERLYCDTPKGYRINLHVIHPCPGGQVLLHPHPWPSAVHVLPPKQGGAYEMGSGFSATNEPPARRKLIRQISTGELWYEMMDPDQWHYVRPLGSISLSVMLTGKPWKRWSPKGSSIQPLLSCERVTQILNMFCDHFEK